SVAVRDGERLSSVRFSLAGFRLRPAGVPRPARAGMPGARRAGRNDHALAPTGWRGGGPRHPRRAEILFVSPARQRLRPRAALLPAPRPDPPRARGIESDRPRLPPPRVPAPLSRLRFQPMADVRPRVSAPRQAAALRLPRPPHRHPPAADGG